MVVFREHSESCASSILESEFSEEEGGSTFSTVLTRQQNGLKVEGIYRATSVRLPVRAVTKKNGGAVQVVSRISPKTVQANNINNPQPAAPRETTITEKPLASSLSSSAGSSSFSTPTSQQTVFTIPTLPAAAHLASPETSKSPVPARPPQNGDIATSADRAPQRQGSGGFRYDPAYYEKMPVGIEDTPTLGATMGFASPAPSIASETKDGSRSGRTTRSNSQRDYSRGAGTSRSASGMDNRIASPYMSETYEENMERPESILSEKVPASPVNLLNRLWTDSEGALKYQYHGTFVLNIYQKRPREYNRYSSYEIPEHFIFGTDKDMDFYTLSAHAAHPYSETRDELILSRRDPNTGHEITAMTMDISKGIPPVGDYGPIDPYNPDMLVTYLYPQRSVDRAVSMALPAEKSVGDVDISEIGAKAVNQVHQRDGCRLSYDPLKGQYYLFHPGIVNSGDDVFFIETIAIKGQPGFGLRTKGRILLINRDTKETVVGVDFATGQLFIDGDVCARYAQFKHFIDIAVSAVLAVCTVEGRRYRPFDAPPMPDFPAPPSHAAGSALGRRSIAPTTYYTDSHGISRSGTRRTTRRQTMMMKEPKEPKWSDPFVAVGKGFYKFMKAIAFGIIFAVGLGFEIIKAIFDAFRPLPKDDDRQGQGQVGRGYDEERGVR